MRTFPLFVSLAVLSVLVGCSSQPAAPEKIAEVPSTAPSSPAPIVVPSPVKAQSAPLPPPDPYALSALNDPKSPLAKRSVHFDFDSYAIKDEYKDLLDHHAKFMARNPQIKMMIQGNADERGSREYNLSLGQKRAEAVKKALTLLGIQEARTESVSLGEEKPVCKESNESCWSMNRRADMLYTGEF